MCLIIRKSNFNNYKIVKNTSSVKQNNWATGCTQNEALRAWETLIWLEIATEKVTGNAQLGACVDVLPRCYLTHNQNITLAEFSDMERHIYLFWLYFSGNVCRSWRKGFIRGLQEVESPTTKGIFTKSWSENKRNQGRTCFVGFRC